MPLSFGLIGYGHFGAFLHVLAQRYLTDAPLKIHSGRRTPDGVFSFPLEEVAACVASHFGRVFAREMIRSTPDEMLAVDGAPVAPEASS